MLWRHTRPRPLPRSALLRPSVTAARRASPEPLAVGVTVISTSIVRVAFICPGRATPSHRSRSTPSSPTTYDVLSVFEEASSLCPCGRKAVQSETFMAHMGCSASSMVFP